MFTEKQKKEAGRKGTDEEEIQGTYYKEAGTAKEREKIQRK